MIKCVFHRRISVYYGVFIFTGYRIHLSDYNMSTYHVYHGADLHAGVM